MKKIHFLPLLITLVFGTIEAHADSKNIRQPYQKPGASIRLAQPQSIELEPFSQKTVDISFATPKAGKLVLSYNTKAGITTSASINEWTFDLSTQQPNISFDINSGETGQFHIMFHARIINGSENSSRVFGIPVYVGDQTANVKQKVQHPAVISMKAEETVN